MSETPLYSGEDDSLGLSLALSVLASLSLSPSLSVSFHSLALFLSLRTRSWDGPPAPRRARRKDGTETCFLSALYCWILEILYCNPKGRRALLRVPSTVGRSVCLCWEHSKPKGPKGLDNLLDRIHFIIDTICWTSLAPWELKLCFPASLIHQVSRQSLPSENGAT